MYAITGITGKVGGEVARALLAAGRSVRGVVRDAGKAGAWRAGGCELATATMEDPAALSAAFAGAEGVFVLLPPLFDPSPDFSEVRRIVAALDAALRAARPARVVCLSTIGAQAAEPNLLSQLGVMERVLGELPMPVTFVRPAWFMENSSWDVAPARTEGVIPSFLQPLDRAVPMVATADVGRVAAELIQETWVGRRIVELEGPRPVAPNDIAGTFARLLGRPVRCRAVPRETWEELFRAQGMRNPTPRMRMLDGFNEGWIEFEGGPGGVRKGGVELGEVLAALVAEEGRPAR